MQLLRLSEVSVSPDDRVFRHSPVRALLPSGAVLGVSVACLIFATRRGSVVAYYIAGVLLLGLVLMRRLITARLRPTNWLAIMSGAGLYIQFRSYLNYHLPLDVPTVLFIPYSEIRCARTVQERQQVADMEGATETRTLRFVELELAGDPAPLAQALAEEASRRGPREKRWYGTSSTFYRESPVRMLRPPFLQLQWTVVPGIAVILKALRQHVAIADPLAVTEDFAHLQDLSKAEQEKRIHALDASGQTIAAIYAAQKLYGHGLGEAKALVEALRKRSNPEL